MDTNETVQGAQVDDAKMFRDLGHPVRLQILQYLLDGEMNVTEMVENLDGPAQGRVSSHLT